MENAEDTPEHIPVCPKYPLKHQELDKTNRCTARWPPWHAARMDNYRLSQNWIICTAEMNSMFCVEWASDHGGLGLLIHFGEICVKN